MITFSSLDLQVRTGDIQVTAVHAAVLITHHGRPRAVVLSYEELCREVAGPARAPDAQVGKNPQ